MIWQFIFAGSIFAITMFAHVSVAHISSLHRLTSSGSFQDKRRLVPHHISAPPGQSARWCECEIERFAAPPPSDRINHVMTWVPRHRDAEESPHTAVYS
jgi:hypothetical protein